MTRWSTARSRAGQRHPGGAQRGLDVGREVAAVVICHRHVEAAVAAPGNRLADAAHAQDAQRGAVHVAAGEHVEAPVRPPAFAQETFALGDAARRGHHQREAEVGRGLGEHARRVGDDHAARRAGRHVDVVVADGHRADGLELRAGVQQHGVDLLAAGDEHAGATLQRGDQLGLRQRWIGVVRAHLEVGAQAVDDVAEHAAGDEDDRFRHEWNFANSSTVARAVARRLATASGSATPSAMPHTTISWSPSSSSRLITRWNCVNAA